ncbi:bifunctional hydroxymethylpyrimidine kinase/phosphomethylpyrimidine kinase [Larsenimonas rhizosphaerae]|uniref:hydroxymethylpyrimidine kinase n=1 Tax=Larsenimonas rhizosphaerae TaxID=2944682 RepID=A0AA41ZLE4_9GAMM|nr:hydroxymethylpyrimidine/phosphomethylpyrimidine kinase [Larsenimonas rhizosphaerae]MCX2523933.1 hydroxymethylpyrimidine/phosphomethylpyrimidine kinase [Larsenimonas rhizosphaerae]
MLVFSGHDPTGGAGMVADVEAIRAQQGWPVTVPTALTVQDSRDVHAVYPVDPQVMAEQVHCIEQDMSLQAIKVGLVSSLEAITVIEQVCRRHPEVPVVIDPVLKAGGGRELSSDTLVDAFRERLLPLVTLLTPNHLELFRLAGTPDVDDALHRIYRQGAEHVLVTGTDHAPLADRVVRHQLYTGGNPVESWVWSRLPGQFHGSGCTLAASCAVWLARGETVVSSCLLAQRYTWQTLDRSLQQGGGQAFPNRCPTEQESAS